MNLDLARTLLNDLAQFGVKDIVICPGGRNAPFLELLSRANHEFNLFSFFDERSAGFFALGKSKKNAAPVAVITTSGTAVAELLPAVIEAYYKSVPLIIVSADRPKSMRGSGAPQTIEQKDIFSCYVEKCVDIFDVNDRDMNWSMNLPLHWNVGFDEPLLSGDLPHLKNTKLNPIQKTEAKKINFNIEKAKNSFDDFCKKSKKPILMLTETFAKGSAQNQLELLKKIDIPIYAETTSLCAFYDLPQMIRGGDKTLLQSYKTEDFDGVIRLGGVPTNKLWRFLEEGKLPVFNLSEFPFAGISASHVHLCEFFDGLLFLSQQRLAWNFSSIKANDIKISNQTDSLIKEFPQAEPSLMYKLSKMIGDKDYVYVGNSLPIREWDWVANSKKLQGVFTNRGANGIDGQLATALAMVNEGETLWVILGDLTYMYDMNAHWAIKYLPKHSKIKIVCINNGGGKIFENLFNSSIYYNSHDTNFDYLAKFWGLDYWRWEDQTSDSDLPTQLESSKPIVIEIIPDNLQTQNFTKGFSH